MSRLQPCWSMHIIDLCPQPCMLPSIQKLIVKQSRRRADSSRDMFDIHSCWHGLSRTYLTSHPLTVMKVSLL